MTAEDYDPESALVGRGGRLRLLEIVPNPDCLSDCFPIGPSPTDMRPFPAVEGRAPVRHLPGERDHFVQFYESDAFLVDSLCGFLGPAIVAAEAVIVIATPEHRGALESRLAASGVDVNAAILDGRYISLDAADMMSIFMAENSPDRHRFFDLVGGVISRAGQEGRAVRIFGEIVALLCAEGNHSGAIALESLWNELRTAHEFTLLCAYPMRTFEGQGLAVSLAGVCGEHADVAPTESYMAIAEPAGQLRAITVLQQKAISLEAEIAERKRAEDALNGSIRLRDDFLSAISHDLRTPLAVVQGNAQVLRRRWSRGTLDPEAMCRTLELIESKTKAMTRLIDELLDVTRLRAGEELHLDLRPVDLVPLVRDVVGPRDVSGHSSGRVLIVGDDEVWGRWDAPRLARVVENLIANAIKYSRESAEVSVTVSREQGPDGCARLSVSDRGIGIAAEDLPHIFEQFYRGRNAAGRIAGAGLGLAGAQRIVELHGGTIEVESRLGQGSTFTVRLPI